MSGVLGWVGLRDQTGPPTLDAMTVDAARVDGASFASATEPGIAVASGGPSRTSGVFRRHGLIAAFHGHPFWNTPDGRYAELVEVATLLLDAFVSRDVAALGALHGDYALALVDPKRERTILAVDRMGVRNIVYARTPNGIVFGPTCDVVSRHPLIRQDVDPQALYDYLYFHMVPGPATVFRGHLRVPPGHFVDCERGTCTVSPYWRAHFVENATSDFASLKQAFRTALEESVRTFGTGANCGTFLSGGTDSSTISGLLGIVSGAPAQTFSIGFEAEGYDEMQYARLAVRHFGTVQHEYYVTPADVVDAVPRIAGAYDQPFGNASAVPTYFCAKLARESGVSRILGGDGGDELFGGNSRYAQQFVFALYERLPAVVRRALIEPIANRIPSTGQPALLRKLGSYVAQASMPMPDRYESYNLLDRLGPANVLTADFLAGVDSAAPIRRLREIYGKADAKSLINRMLALDFQITLADNDLPKVTRMCELARVDVAFPMLHDDVVDFSLLLAPEQKVRGTRLRYFFKEALKDFLPPAIISKQKHGFGLPFGVWLKNTPSLRALAGDTLATLRGRQIIRPDFIDSLLNEHVAVHAGYYGTMVWVLIMLELWFHQHASARNGV
jgi:asparagine synthase (glutamine-hydrolysing)